ncbi:type 2 isopentenyl-diphosphate Delta-isomerase [Alicyclobacillus curvatus]|nr:type 2 isopentenyl-diphosphate Delta-isomerase [Alicyclobacillus curvatus]
MSFDRGSSGNDTPEPMLDSDKPLCASKSNSLLLRKTRKAEHINLAVEYNEQTKSEPWHDVRFVHHSLPELAAEEVDLSTVIAGTRWRVPLYINAMTGGIQEAANVNRNLAEVAKKHQLAIAVGSQSAALSDRKVIDTYRVVRDVMEDGVVLANVSASTAGEDALRAVDMLQADYLQLHLNFPQEIVMPEGDRDFRGIARNIQQIIGESPVPVIVKEVGFGMSMELYQQLTDVGVRVVDVSGRGGTNFAWIESRRRKDKTSLFDDWGQTTAVSLLEAQSFLDKMQFLGSGGIRTALDMAKAISLGASAIGVAGPVLSQFYRGGQEAVTAQVAAWLNGLRSVMLALGATSTQELQSIPVVVTGETRDWAELRGIDVNSIARRTRPMSP